jgi:hypothetical protein
VVNALGPAIHHVHLKDVVLTTGSSSSAESSIRVRSATPSGAARLDLPHRRPGPPGLVLELIHRRAARRRLGRRPQHRERRSAAPRPRRCPRSGQLHYGRDGRERSVTRHPATCPLTSAALSQPPLSAKWLSLGYRIREADFPRS